jgi:hypothetical protein
VFTHLAIIAATDGFEHPLARLGVIDQRISLGAVHQLEVLRPGRSEYGSFRWHGGDAATLASNGVDGSTRQRRRVVNGSIGVAKVDRLHRNFLIPLATENRHRHTDIVDTCISLLRHLLRVYHTYTMSSLFGSGGAAPGEHGLTVLFEPTDSADMNARKEQMKQQIQQEVREWLDPR